MVLPTIRAVLVDIGGVLLTNGWDSGMRRRAAEVFNLDFAEMDDRHNQIFDVYEEGKVALDQYLARVIFYRERLFTPDAVKVFMFAQSRPYPQMIELVRGLKERFGLRVAAVNNEGRELNEHRIRTFHLADFIDVFISSCYVHMRKPDEDMFRLALDQVHAVPAEVVYIDDRPVYAEVAAGLGLWSIHHTSFEATRDALAGIGLAVTAPAGTDVAHAGRGRPSPGIL
ncbi:MAG: HAD family phosphatase [Planctomycetota bacterium]|nr:HAD family phosphatase [Planctomycetota bacterium]